MSNSWIGIDEPTTIDKLVDTEQVSGGGPSGLDTVHRERFLIAGQAIAELARVMNTAPGGTEYALLVRAIIATLPLPAGAATEATLAALNAKVVQGHGTAAQAQRVELPTDGTGQVALAAGTTVGITGTVPVSGAVTVSGTVAATQSGAWALSPNQTVDLALTGGAAVAKGHGTAATALRVELPTDGTGQVAALQQGAWSVSIAGTATVTGTVAVTGTIAATQSGAWNIGTVSTVAAVTGGGVAHDSADSGNPIKVGGRGRLTDVAAVSQDDRTDFITSLLGKQVVLPYALPGQALAFASATGGLTTTAGVTMFAAAGAGIKNYLTRIQVMNSNPTVGTEVVVRDGASGAVKWRGWAQAAGGGCVVQIEPPIAGTANTLMEVAAVTSTPTNGVIVSAQGYTSTE